MTNSSQNAITSTITNGSASISGSTPTVTQVSETNCMAVAMHELIVTFVGIWDWSKYKL